MHSTTSLLQPPRLLHPTGSLLQDTAEKNGGADCTVDLKDDLASITDDVEKSLRSTSSTTACDGEDDIEPERFNQFMKQALQSAESYRRGAKPKPTGLWHS